MNTENILKGKISSQVVGLMFQEANYLVLPYSDVLNILIQCGLSKTDKTAKKIRVTPSMLIMNKKTGLTTLLYVKYQGIGSKGRNIAWGYEQLEKYWPEGQLLLACPRKPYFFLVSQTKNGLQALSLLENNVFKIDKQLIHKFGRILKKFLS